jgi:hypothetical protein
VDIDAAPRLRGPGLTRRRCGVSWVAELGSLGWVNEAHGATITSAPEAVGTRVTLEDVGPMCATETFDAVGLALSPRDPQERGPFVGTLVLPAHCLLPPLIWGTGGEAPIPSLGARAVKAHRTRGSPLLCRPTPPAWGAAPEASTSLSWLLRRITTRPGPDRGGRAVRGARADMIPHVRLGRKRHGQGRCGHREDRLHACRLGNPPADSGRALLREVRPAGRAALPLTQRGPRSASTTFAFRPAPPR